MKGDIRMKIKYIICFIVLTLLNSSCILMSDKYYETKAVEWQSKAIAAKSYNDKIETRLANIDPSTGVITLYNQNQASPISIHSDSNPFVEGLNATLNSGAVKLLTGGLAFKLATDNMQGNSYNSNGNMSVTRDSGNAINHTTKESTVYGDKTMNSNNSKSSSVDDHSSASSYESSYEYSENHNIDDRENYNNTNIDNSINREWITNELE